MFLFLALFGFLPVDGALPVGPPGPVLDQDRAAQLRLGNTPAWRAFRHRWGGEVAARFDQRTGVPRFVWLPGVPDGRAEALVADLARLAGVDPDELALTREVARGDRAVLRYGRTWKGVEVEGDEVALVSVQGRIAGAWVRLTPLGSPAISPRPDELVLVVPPRGVPAVVRKVETPEAVSYLDRSGRVVYAWDPRRHATVEHTWEERTVGDTLVTSGARGVTVTDSAGVSEVTATDGSHSRSGALSVRWGGDEFMVYDDGSDITVTGTDSFVVEAGTDLSYSASDVLWHAFAVKDWLTARWPTHAWLADQVPTNVDITASACNAYYTSGTINFYVGYSGYCEDLGRVSDVVYHEYGHGIHDYIIASGTFAGDVSEGSADFVSSTLHDDWCLAPGAFTSYSCLRELDTDKVYPDDVIGEVHNDGLIWGSFLWNLREDWLTTYGDPTGAEMVDALFLGALEYGPTLTDLYEAVLLADDDDGDLTNGVPHGCELKTLLDAHGLGPGPIGVVVFDHEPLGPQSSATDGYPVSFELYDLLVGCSGLDSSSVKLWYTADDSPLPGTESTDTGDTADTATSATSGWTEVPLTASGTTWTGTLPRQPATRRVRYYMSAASTDGSEVLETHGGREEDVYSFWVGDRHALWCEDFESGATTWTHGTGTFDRPGNPGGWVDEWETGTFTGAGAHDPDAPYAGASAMGTVIDGNYAANNSEYLASPEVDVSASGPMLLVSARRWLTVEDGYYDQASWVVNGTELYANLVTSGGSTATLDGGWTLMEYPAADLVDADLTLQFVFSLRSDGGLEYGGWALDDACVYDLDDVPGHYRVDDLVATDDGATVTVTWTQPWMTPLGEVTMVRRRDGWPTGPTDGDVLDVDPDPEPGERRMVVDKTLAEGEVAWYAVFVTAGGSDGYYTDLVEGENADVGGVPLPPVDTGDSAPTDTGDSVPIDTGDPTADSAPDTAPDPDEGEEVAPRGKPEPPGGCGCGTSAPAGPAALLLGLLALRRRR